MVHAKRWQAQPGPPFLAKQVCGGTPLDERGGKDSVNLILKPSPLLHDLGAARHLPPHCLRAYPGEWDRRFRASRTFIGHRLQPPKKSTPEILGAFICQEVSKVQQLVKTNGIVGGGIGACSAATSISLNHSNSIDPICAALANGLRFCVRPVFCRRPHWAPWPLRIPPLSPRRFRASSWKR
ncbi:hypothetical protein CBM2634_P130014 [Cupriavidus taiwanensis]|uniref:Uncharacterized protein n=1 Tax=Cupriavidus taiwanensis TaxID=164546 RepID=A0A375JAE5_9BURK|nr:hypothetical protein CBM2634_P130014 [Cupriavidus taiwanensis]